jgi:hypothetical protein
MAGQIVRLLSLPNGLEIMWHFIFICLGYNLTIYNFASIQKLTADINTDQNGEFSNSTF